MGDKCFCHLNGLEVKDAKARNAAITPQMFGYKSGDLSDYLLAAISSGLTVHVPNGDYTITKEIQVPEAQEIIFDSNANVTLSGSGKFVLDRASKLQGGRFLGSEVPVVMEMRSTTKWMQQAKILNCYIHGDKESTNAIVINTTAPYVAACYCVVDNVHISGCRYGVITKTGEWSNNHKIDVYCAETTTAIDLAGSGCMVRVAGQAPTTESVPVIISGENNMVEVAIYDIRSAQYAVELTETSRYNIVTEFGYWYNSKKIVDKGNCNKISNLTSGAYDMLNRPPTGSNNILTAAEERGKVRYSYDNASCLSGEAVRKSLFNENWINDSVYFKIGANGSITIDVDVNCVVSFAGITFLLENASPNITEIYASTDGETFNLVKSGWGPSVNHAWSEAGTSFVTLRFVLKNNTQAERIIRCGKIFAVGRSEVTSFIPTNGGAIWGALEWKQGFPILSDTNGVRYGIGVNTNGELTTWKM